MPTENNNIFYQATAHSTKRFNKTIDTLRKNLNFPIVIQNIELVWGKPLAKYHVAKSFSDFFNHLTQHKVHINEIRNYDGILTIDIINQTGTSWYEIKKLTDTGLEKVKKTNFDEINQDLLNDIYTHDADSTHLDLT